MIDKAIGKSCTGCNMCADVCPKGAISYKLNEEGFEYPVVDYDKCVKCGLCLKKCPSINKELDFRKDVPKVYSAWINDENVRIKSTSGGIYYALAKKMIENGGYICGSIYDNNYKGAYHIIGNTMEDLNKIMGSKYFQSTAKTIYIQIQKLLENGKKVLFCGTPCQSAALQSFLKKEYENLYIIDFICRGINSPLAFKKHIEELEKQYGSKVKLVQLKNKINGWQSLATYVEFKNGKKYLADKNKSPWVKGFVGTSGLYTRESCFNCNYRKLPRISDITIGDFWGIKNMNENDLFKGISSVMVNSQKGEKMFYDLGDIITYERRNLDELLNGNPALLEGPTKSNERNKFFKLLSKYKFSDAVKICIENKKQSLIQKIFRKIKSILSKIGKVCTVMFECDTFKFIKYNYFSKNIIRDKNVYLIPYKGTIIDLSKDAKIYIKGSNLILNINKLKKSKAEMHLRMEGNAKWYCNNGANLFYNTVVEIKSGGVFDTGFFSANGGSVIIAAKRIKFGEDVMLGRNIIIYDSDFHQVFDQNMEATNYAREVTIDDHVWLTSNITVLKGSHISRDSIVTSTTLIRKDFDSERTVIGGESSGKVIGTTYGWSRKMVKRNEDS